MMITGQRGSGNCFVINVHRQRLNSYCIASSFLDIATFTVNGITLNLPLKLPIREKNCCE